MSTLSKAKNMRKKRLMIIRDPKRLPKVNFRNFGALILKEIRDFGFLKFKLIRNTIYFLLLPHHSCTILILDQIPKSRKWQWANPLIEGVSPSPRGGHTATLSGSTIVIFGVSRETREDRAITMCFIGNEE